MKIKKNTKFGIEKEEEKEEIERKISSESREL